MEDRNRLNHLSYENHWKTFSFVWNAYRIEELIDDYVDRLQREYYDYKRMLDSLQILLNVFLPKYSNDCYESNKKTKHQFEMKEFAHMFTL